MTDWKAVPTFGVPDSRLPRVIRPSAYGLIAGSPDQLAVVRTPTGVYLPGGGIQGTESPEATVCREAQEECGLAIRLSPWRRAAIDHVTAPREAAHFEKRSTFCGATVIAAPAAPAEPDHLLTWVVPADALNVLTPPSHRWAVAEWLADRSATQSSRPAV